MVTYTIKEILHSGRKGIRGTHCDDEKYRYIEGCRISFEWNELQRGKELTFHFHNHPFYIWWDTSMVLAAVIDKENRLLHIETENTIYVLKEEADGDSGCGEMSDLCWSDGLDADGVSDRKMGQRAAVL